MTIWTVQHFRVLRRLQNCPIVLYFARPNIYSSTAGQGLDTSNVLVLNFGYPIGHAGGMQELSCVDASKVVCQESVTQPDKRPGFSLFDLPLLCLVFLNEILSNFASSSM